MVRVPRAGWLSPLATVGAALDRPIFVVGCGRSGTTLLYQMLCGHRDVAWFSSWSERWPRVPQLAVGCWLYPMMRTRGIRRRGLPIPSEGYRAWRYIRGRNLGPGLGENDVKPGERERATELLAGHLRYSRRPRFLNKNTGNVTRIAYVHALFPDALIVHLTRHPVAVVASILNVAFWPELRVWCFDSLTPREWVAAGNHEEEMAAELWRREMEIAVEQQAGLARDHYFELRYEDLVAGPRQKVAEILSYVGLEWTQSFDEVFRTFQVDDANRRVRDRLSSEQIARVQAIVAPQAEPLGYDVDLV